MEDTIKSVWYRRMLELLQKLEELENPQLQMIALESLRTDPRFRRDIEENRLRIGNTGRGL